jgi:hypothetical protein
VTTLQKTVRNACWMPYVNEVFILGAKGFRFSRTHTPAVGTPSLLLNRFCEDPSAAVEMSGVLKLITRFHLMQRLRTTGDTHLTPPRTVMWYTGTVSHLPLKIRPLELPRLQWGLENFVHTKKEREFCVSQARHGLMLSGSSHKEALMDIGIL